MPATPIPDTLDICTAISRARVTTDDVIAIVRAATCSNGRWDRDTYRRQRVQELLEQAIDEIEDEFCRPPTAEEAAEWARERMYEARFEDARLGDLA